MCESTENMSGGENEDDRNKRGNGNNGSNPLLIEINRFDDSKRASQNRIYQAMLMLKELSENNKQ
jgi:hypothetical protein